jgi:hypothetical protein
MTGDRMARRYRGGARVNQGSGTVMKALLCGGGTIELATGQNGVTEVVILGGDLYWTAVGGNQLATIPE